MIAVVLAGGKGLRLWPESRRLRPKQLCSFVQGRSMLDHTIDRLVQAGASRVLVITSDELLPKIEALLAERADSNIIQILSEPEGKNTAPAVGLALSRLYRENSDEVMAVFPADHHILDTRSFQASVATALRAAENNHLATIGIAPSRPETGFGYIEKMKWEISELPDVYPVQSFCEKPDRNTAESYLNSGNHLWNAGIYIGKQSVFVEEFMHHLPTIYNRIIEGYDAYRDAYQDLPSISIDYGIAEKSNRMAVVPGDFGWCDLGSWSALAEVIPADDKGNVTSGEEVIILESSDCIVKQAQKAIVLFDVHDLLVVETDNVILVSRRHRSQDFRQLVNYVEEQQRPDLL